MPTVKNPPQGHKLRKGRFSEANRIYLLTTVTHNRRAIFSNILCARIVVHAMQYQQQKQNLYSMAYVIMPDHLHWLIQLKGENTLEDIMRRVKGFSALKINQHLGEAGRVWQSGYHDHAIRAEEDIESIARYIITNPLRAGLVSRVGDYSLWDAIWV